MKDPNDQVKIFLVLYRGRLNGVLYVWGLYIPTYFYTYLAQTLKSMVGVSTSKYAGGVMDTSYFGKTEKRHHDHDTYR